MSTCLQLNACAAILTCKADFMTVHFVCSGPRRVEIMRYRKHTA